MVISKVFMASKLLDMKIMVISKVFMASTLLDMKINTRKLVLGELRFVLLLLHMQLYIHDQMIRYEDQSTKISLRQA